MKIFKIIFVLFLSSAAHAQEGVDQFAINSVVQEIVTGSGPVTKEQYDKFWSQLGATKAEEKTQMINLMKQRFVLAQEYQREVWSCAEQAWNSHSVPPCQGAQNKLALLTSEMRRTESESMLSPMTEYSNNLLKAAANRTSIQNPNGAGEVKITLEMIRNTREGLDKMLNRLGQILRPNY